MDEAEAKKLKIYFIITYLLFWLFIAIIGYLISIDVPLLVQTILKNVCSWTPTFVILIMFKKLYPDVSFKEYFKLHFTKKINLRNFLSSFLLQAAVAVAAVIAFFIITNKPLSTMTFIASSSILPVLITDLTSGALGEELGWRGYALNILQKKYAPLTAGVIVGIVWGFWHLPLMIFSGYSGLELVYYIVAFMVAVISCSVVITFFYNKSKNILIAMWMHFWFNFLLKIVIIDLLPLLIFISLGYFTIATLIVVFHKKELLAKKTVGIDAN
jgi:membrane protease YdiL (CAAX protease family)